MLTEDPRLALKEIRLDHGASLLCLDISVQVTKTVTPWKYQIRRPRTDFILRIDNYTQFRVINGYFLRFSLICSTDDTYFFVFILIWSGQRSSWSPSRFFICWTLYIFELCNCTNTTLLIWGFEKKSLIFGFNLRPDTRNLKRTRTLKALNAVW